MKRLLIALLVSCFAVTSLNAQFGSHWRKLRHEVIVGIGSTNFMGELGGSDKAGSHFIRDFEFASSRPLIYVGYRYKLHPNFALRGSAYYGYISGNDALSDDIYRKARNISFRSPLAELGVNFEYHILKEKYGHRYDLRRIRGKGNKPSLYIFTGVAGFYFNPQGKYTDDTWYNLQPLGTEGQGIVSTREKYSRFSVAIPMGFGVGFLINRQLAIGAEFGFRYTFTDYLDDVSTTYVDNDLFEDPVAAYFADPSDDWNGSATYNQRGNPRYNDVYMFLTLNVSYKLKKRGRGRSKF